LLARRQCSARVPKLFWVGRNAIVKIKSVFSRARNKIILGGAECNRKSE